MAQVQHCPLTIIGQTEGDDEIGLSHLFGAFCKERNQEKQTKSRDSYYQARIDSDRICMMLWGPIDRRSIGTSPCDSLHHHASSSCIIIHRHSPSPPSPSPPSSYIIIITATTIIIYHHVHHHHHHHHHGHFKKQIWEP
jgi:hypothetical protein